MTIEYRIGDCLELIKGLECKVDAIVTDPPYRIGTNGGGGIAAQRELWGGGQLKGLGATDDFEVCKYLESFRAICSPFVAIVWTQKKGLHELIDWSEGHGFSWDLMAWHKPRSTPLCNGHAPIDSEWAVVINEPGSYRPKTFNEYGESWLVAPQERRRGIAHPTMKPVSMMMLQVTRACPKGGLVLDPFAGSGTTLEAALATGRNAIGFEIDPQWEHYLKRIGGLAAAVF